MTRRPDILSYWFYLRFEGYVTDGCNTLFYFLVYVFCKPRFMNFQSFLGCSYREAWLSHQTSDHRRLLLVLEESFCFGLDHEWKPRNKSHFKEPRAFGRNVKNMQGKTSSVVIGLVCRACPCLEDSLLWWVP